MQKSISSRKYVQFRACLRQAREQAGLTQSDLAGRLGETQTFVSKCERGERRIDLVELQEFCKAMGITLEKFVRQFEHSLR
ncbi:MAG: helix-turn-helix domain-containing protein [Acidiferrobacteraceae bacterium]